LEAAEEGAAALEAAGVVGTASSTPTSR